MKIQFENTLEDVIAFSQHFNKTSPSMRRRRLITLLYFPILWFLIMVLPYISGNLITIYIIIWIVVSLVWILFMSYFSKKSITRNVRKLYSEGENKGTIGKHTMVVNPDSLVDITEYGEFSIKWNAINKIESDENYIFIYISSVSAHVIPKKSFVSDLEIENFISEVQKNINKSN